MAVSDTESDDLMYRAVQFVDTDGVTRTRLEEIYPRVSDQPTGLDYTTADASHPVDMPGQGSYRNNARLYGEKEPNMPMLDVHRSHDPSYVVTTPVDDATRKRAEQKIKESEELVTFVSDVEAVYEGMAVLLRNKRQAYGPSNLLEDGMLGITARMGDKLSRIRRMAKSGTDRAADDESLDDALRDIIGYCTLALIHRKKGEI